MASITCSGPNHAGLSAQPGWQAVVGSSPRDVLGMLCGACAVDVANTQRTADNIEGVARLAAFNAFRTATSLTVAQIRRLFDAHDKGET